MTSIRETYSVESKLFGPFEVDAETVMKFPEGIPGLETVNEYAMVTIQEYAPIVWMISMDGVYHFPLVLYKTIDVNDLDSDSRDTYKAQLDAYLSKKEHSIAYVILQLDSKIQTVSLRCPIVIDLPNKHGKQLILDTPSSQESGVR
jgi:flagellar assembly factor FliW